MEPADESIYKVLSDLFRYRDYGNHAEGDRGVVRWELRATLVTCRPARCAIQGVAQRRPSLVRRADPTGGPMLILCLAMAGLWLFVDLYWRSKR